MKAIIISILFLFVVQIIHCQKKVYIQLDNIAGNRNGIDINLYNNKTRAVFWISNKSIGIKGNLVITGNIYKCTQCFFFDIILKRIDEFRLQVLNKNLFFRQNEILYCIEYKDSLKRHIMEDMYWENGLRQGVWKKYLNRKILFIEWDKGVRKKTYIKTFKQIEEESKHTLIM